MRTICVVTGTRAEYGMLKPVLGRLAEHSKLALQIIATGMHLSPEFGETYSAIEQDGFTIDRKVEMLLSSDSPVGITKSVGLGVIGFADALAELQPDMLLVLGDRFEILAVVQAALIARIPVAHLCGGDTTEGAFDEAIRHSITKMSHLHFVTNAEAEKRVLQLGESSDSVFNVGSTGIDAILELPLLKKEELEQELGMPLRVKNLLITFHPETLTGVDPSAQMDELLQALDMLGEDFGLIITMPNADTGGRVLIAQLEEFAQHRANASVYTSLGSIRYLSAMKHCDVVVGNSSSGLYEAPSLKTPTVNIGDRQRGRARAQSVIDALPEKEAIVDAIQRALQLDCSVIESPYGNGGAAQKIVDTLAATPDFVSLVTKRFHTLEKQ